MTQSQFFKEFVNERLTAAGEEIFRLFEQTVLRYEEEINRQQRLLSIGLLKPESHIQPQRTEIFAGDEEQLDGQSWQQLQQPQQPNTFLQTKSTGIQCEPNINLIVDQKVQLSIGEEKEEELVSEPNMQKSDHGKDQSPFVRSLVCTTKDDPAGNVSLVVIKAESVQVEDYCEDDFSNNFEKNERLKEESVSREITTSMDQGEENEHVQCSYCAETFPDFTTCQIHMWSHGGEKPFNCDTCGKSFSTKELVKRHMITHTGLRPFACDVCGKTFNCSSNCETHMKTHSDERPHVCTICGKGFIRGADLTRHYRTHTGSKPFTCGVCGKTFACSSNRFTHMKTHSDEKPHVCSTCGKSFSRNADLRRHLRSHTGEKPYRCKYCSQEFPYHTSLKNHLLTHTGEKPYMCMWCGKRFALKFSLKTHTRIHTGERPYKCNECGKSFSNSTSLSVHRMTHTSQTHVTNCV
ncbi:zinc finger protein OZF-like [Gouania willdenowi]|uniref:zinc finger protein OZF-like n=1 Tax=Gouania willdenowi TaxID=441366 RepID=UPI00105698BE|nr:zinc finger protein OZF-like [Gouania willdenowi]